MRSSCDSGAPRWSEKYSEVIDEGIAEWSDEYKAAVDQREAELRIKVAGAAVSSAGIALLTDKVILGGCLAISSRTRIDLQALAGLDASSGSALRYADKADRV
jgi:hypothetical protein